jgi:hypothetical protein
VDQYLALVEMYMLLRNLSKFIQLRVFYNQGMAELIVMMISHIPTTQTWFYMWNCTHEMFVSNKA